MVLTSYSGSRPVQIFDIFLESLTLRQVGLERYFLGEHNKIISQMRGKTAGKTRKYQPMKTKSHFPFSVISMSPFRSSISQETHS